jgi:hypothetical protein
VAKHPIYAYPGGDMVRVECPGYGLDGLYMTGSPAEVLTKFKQLVEWREPYRKSVI